jgi:hypothetical protein
MNDTEAIQAVCCRLGHGLTLPAWDRMQLVTLEREPAVSHFSIQMQGPLADLRRKRKPTGTKPRVCNLVWHLYRLFSHRVTILIRVPLRGMGLGEQF